MTDIGDYLRKRTAELGLERHDQLIQIQKYLDQQYPNLCRAASLQDGALKIMTHNASLASELRMRQVEIIKDLVDFGVQRIYIRIASS